MGKDSDVWGAIRAVVALTFEPLWWLADKYGKFGIMLAFLATVGVVGGLAGAGFAVPVPETTELVATAEGPVEVSVQAPRWPFAVALPSALLVVLLGIAAVRLQLRLSTDAKPLTMEVRRTDVPLGVPAPWKHGRGGNVGRSLPPIVCTSDRPVQVNRIRAVSQVRFGKRDHAGYIVTPSVAYAEPAGAAGLGTAAGWEFRWDVQDVSWELVGLPVTLKNTDEIPLPPPIVRLGDASEATSRFADAGWVTLHTIIQAETDVGRFRWEVSTPLVMSRNDDSIVGPSTDETSQ